MKYKNDLLKISNEEYEIKFDDIKRMNEHEVNENINKKLGEIPMDQLLQRLSLKDLLWIFNAVSLYPSEMSDEKSIYPRIENGYAFTPDMYNEKVENFINQIFTQGSAILKKNNIFQKI